MTWYGEGDGRLRGLERSTREVERSVYSTVVVLYTVQYLLLGNSMKMYRGAWHDTWYVLGCPVRCTLLLLLSCLPLPSAVRRCWLDVSTASKAWKNVISRLTSCPYGTVRYIFKELLVATSCWRNACSALLYSALPFSYTTVHLTQ